MPRPRSARRLSVSQLKLRPLEDRLAPATFTVTNSADAGAGSLRAALLAANAHVGADTIAFNIAGAGVHTISPVSALPAITSPVTLAGDTQPGFASTPLIELNGTGAGAGVSGLILGAAGSVVRDLAINRFTGDGIRVKASGCKVEGCFIGTSAAGTAAAANGQNGVRIFAGADNVTIGGTAATARNVISGNRKAGVLIQNIGTTGNKVLGNIIGLTATGAAAVPNWVGVWIAGGATDNVIGGAAGNTISGNSGPGVSLTGAGTASDTVSNNKIGTDPTGTIAHANGADGIMIAAGARAIVVQDNVISANAANGVSIDGTSVSGVRVVGNRIGLNAAGTAALGNVFDGVRITGGAHGNTVGGTTAAARNLIGGNRVIGVEISGAGTTDNAILGNYIGTDVNGTLARGNTLNGVSISASGNVVGGTSAGARNIVSGNGGNGIAISGDGVRVQGNFIGTDATGALDLGNSGAGVTIAGEQDVVGGTTPGVRNIISGNGGVGVEITGPKNSIQGNFIGTNAGATAALGNSGGGVLVQGPDNLIGGTVAGARNIISANSAAGVTLDGYGARINSVQGNFVGTDITGLLDLGNAGAGVLVTDVAQGNLVGGTTTGARNVVSGNTGAGVEIDGAAGFDGTTFTQGNDVQGNFIGTDATGQAALGNSGGGVILALGTLGNTIGGAAAADRNVISGNTGAGVDLVGIMLANRVQGNFIGTDVTGSTALGNSGDGVRIAGGALFNGVGGGSNGVAGNVISGNGGNGVLVTDPATGRNSLTGNKIGVAADGITALANTGHGVFITGTSSSNTVGSGNVIAHNGKAGVLIGTDAAAGFITPAGSGNSVLGNSIFANGGLGIDLGAYGSVTLNDVNDVDAGPNDLVNFPVLTAALLEGTDLLVGGTINTGAGATIRIEFFASPAADASGHGEGQTYLGYVDVTTGAGNTAAFTAAFVTSLVQPGDVITATATVGGSTSEFSLALAVT